MKRVANYTEKLTWHSVEDALPAITERLCVRKCLVVDKDGDVDIAFYTQNGNWQVIGYIVEEKNIIGWAHIPMPVLVEV